MGHAISHAALIVACAGLLDAGLLVAGPLTQAPLARAVSGATVAAAGAAVPPLVLGAVGLGSTPAALLAATAALWLAARGLLPAVRPNLAAQALETWWGINPWQRAALGAAAGLLAVWIAWIARYPNFGFDGVHYHMAEVVTWVREGSPGSVENVFPSFPVGNYPLANELLLAWGCSIARSQAPALMLAPALLVLMGCSGWLGLRAFDVPRWAAVPAVGCLCMAPLVTFELSSVHTDLPALAWVVTTAGLCAAAARGGGAGLLAPALVAAGFAVGTKTTAAPLAVGALAVCAWTLRARLRPVRVPLVLAGLTAVVVGGFWYARNLVDHGSPLWPFLSLPGGDPVPPAIAGFGTRFVERPGATIAEYGHFWRDDYFGAGILVLGAAVLSPLLARTRAVVAGATASALAVAVWTLAPVTGEPAGGFVSGSLYFSLVLSPRYLLPGLALGLFTLGLAARDGGPRTRLLAGAVLVVGLAVSVQQTFALGAPYVPGPWLPVGGSLLGGAAGLYVAAPPTWLAHRATAVAVALVASMALTGAGRNLVGRYAAESPNRKLIDFLAARAVDGRPVFMAPLMLSVVAGDHLDRRVEMVPRHESCVGLRARARHGWLTTEQLPGDALFDVSYVYRCFAGVRPVYDDGKHRVYRLAPPSAALEPAAAAEEPEHAG